jgi:hypothetical protein
MSGQTGHGQTFQFGAQVIPHIQSIQVQDQGNILSEVVADQDYAVREVTPGQFGFTVNFLLPVATPHTLLNAIKSNTQGAIDADVGGVNYDAAVGFSGGFTKSSPSNGWITVSAQFAVSGAVTIAASA